MTNMEFIIGINKFPHEREKFTNHIVAAIVLSDNIIFSNIKKNKEVDYTEMTVLFARV